MSEIELRPIPELTEAREQKTAAQRLDALLEAGAAFRERFASAEPVYAVATAELSTLPYPTHLAFWGAARLPSPYVFLRNRMHVVQFINERDELNTLLVNPHEIEGNIQTPFISRLASRMPAAVKKSLQICRAEAYLQTQGIEPDTVDYLCFDHLHTQDVPTILGIYPNARLIVQRAEWDAVLHLHPVQKHWYHPQVTEGVDPARLLFVEGDVEIGEGVALVFTPGHTAGNHTIVLNTEGGVFCISENGVSADSYAPHASLIPGLARFARTREVEVILNANTMQSSEEQYTAMMLERTIAGPNARNEKFYNVLCSSELTPSWLSPRARPTFSPGRIRYGSINPGISNEEMLRTL